MYALSAVREFLRDKDGYLPFSMKEYADFWRSLSEAEKEAFGQQAAKALRVEIIPLVGPLPDGRVPLHDLLG